jgi:hypothetical protein
MLMNEENKDCNYSGCLGHHAKGTYMLNKEYKGKY